jgi:hypothetical protein
VAKNLNDIYGAPGSGGSRYLKPEDLGGREPVVVIQHAELRTLVGRTTEDKIIVTFVDKTKTLKCNGTQARAIAAAAGTEDWDQWRGVRLRLFPSTTFSGSPTIGVAAAGVAAVARPVARPVPPPIARPVAVNQGPLAVDDIPF